MTMSELDGHKEAAEQSRERVEELENSLIELREKLVEKEDTAAMLLTVQERNRQLDEKVNGLEKQLVRTNACHFDVLNMFCFIFRLKVSNCWRNLGR